MKIPILLLAVLSIVLAGCLVVSASSAATQHSNNPYSSYAGDGNRAYNSHGTHGFDGNIGNYYPDRNNGNQYPRENNDINYPDRNNGNQYPRENNDINYPDRNNGNQYPKDNNEINYPDRNNGNQYPKNNNENHYPKVNESNYYPDRNSANHYPKVNISDYYPKVNISDTYPKVNISDNYPKVNISDYYPKENISDNSPKVNISINYTEVNISNCCPQVNNSSAKGITTYKLCDPDGKCHIGSDGNVITITNYDNATDPTYEKLLTFLKEDKTDEHRYITNQFTCIEFAKNVHDNAEKNGIKCAFIGCDFKEGGIGYAFNMFNTTDRGIVYIDCSGTPEGSTYEDKILDCAVEKPLISHYLFKESTGKEMGTVGKLYTYW